MPPKQKYTDPKLRDQVKEELKQSDKGGAPGQWSARKAQMMAKEYKNRGGDYNTPKSDKDESQQHLEKWGEEEWQTKEGSAHAKKSDGSQKRYLPKKAWEEMSEGEKEQTDHKKQAESKEGKQYVANTGRAKRARKNANDKEDEAYEARQNKEQTSDGEEENDKEKPSPGAKTTRKRGRPTKDEETSEQAKDDNEQDDQQAPPAKKAQKKGRSTTAAGDKSGKTEEQTKDSSKKPSASKKVGSRKDNAAPPAQQASLNRLPAKGAQAYWKALPGWVDGEVVEVLKKGKSVDGKQVKASKDDPRVVLKSNSSGKICVHKVDNVYFD